MVRRATQSGTFPDAFNDVREHDSADALLVDETRNNLGSVRQLATYEAGMTATTIENYLKYDSFGNITREETPAVDHVFGYTGRERDEETGMHFYRARYFDPVVGRFISEDPIGFDAEDTNLFRYVGNSSVRYKDPSGQMISDNEIESAINGLDSDLLNVRERSHRQLMEKIETRDDIFRVGNFIDAHPTSVKRNDVSQRLVSILLPKIRLSYDGLHDFIDIPNGAVVNVVWREIADNTFQPDVLPFEAAMKQILSNTNNINHMQVYTGSQYLRSIINDYIWSPRWHFLEKVNQTLPPDSKHRIAHDLHNLWVLKRDNIGLCPNPITIRTRFLFHPRAEGHGFTFSVESFGFGEDKGVLRYTEDSVPLNNPAPVAPPPPPRPWVEVG